MIAKRISLLSDCLRCTFVLNIVLKADLKVFCFFGDVLASLKPTAIIKNNIKDEKLKQPATKILPINCTIFLGQAAFATLSIIQT
jgi:hypothetical protein